MEYYRGFLTGNLMLDLAITAWFAAQVIKVLIDLAIRRRSSWSALISSGGMPSSHSAFVCALAVSMGIAYGWHSPLFALDVYKRQAQDIGQRHLKRLPGRRPAVRPGNRGGCPF